MKTKTFLKGLVATTTLALTVVITPAFPVHAAEGQSTYTVEKHDNLCKIAKKLTGNERFWRDIFNANRGIVKEGYLIYPGQVLTIPASVTNNTVASAPVTSAAAPEAAPSQAPSTPAAQTPSAPAAQTPSTPAAQAPATPAAQTPSAPAAQTPSAPAAQAPSTPATEETEFTLDYHSIATWVDGGFIGTDGSGSPVVMALNATDDYAIIIFGDNSDMTAASFVGPITYTDTLATITDEANGMSLTFGVTQIRDDTLSLDMGDIGTATIQAKSKEEVLATLKLAIENYRHIA